MKIKNALFVVLLVVSSGCGKAAVTVEEVAATSTAVAIPDISATCSTAACAGSVSTNIVVGAFMATSCAELSGYSGNPSAMSVSAMTCATGTCDSGTLSSWYDNDDAAITTIDAGNYAAVVVFDNNDDSNVMNTGDTACCVDATINSSSSAIVMTSGDCTDL